MIRLSPDEKKLQASIMGQLVMVRRLTYGVPVKARIKALRVLNAADIAYGDKDFAGCQKLIDEVCLQLSTG